VVFLLSRFPLDLPHDTTSSDELSLTLSALSAYMFFVQDFRERIKTENPQATFGELGKLLGAKWQEMSPSEKKVCYRVLLHCSCPLTRSHMRPRPRPTRDVPRPTRQHTTLLTTPSLLP
jgi:hypothetical protein